MNKVIEETILLMNKYGSNKNAFVFIIDFEMENPLVFTLEQLDKMDISFSIDEKPKTTYKGEIELNKFPVEYDSYKNAFDYVVEQIGIGNSYLTNLTFPTKIETNLTLKQIFNYSNAKYKLLFKNDFVVFSPETFVKIENGIISSYPMKGTIDASVPGAEELILKDEKETAEHITIVDLIRNDLSVISKNVKVEIFRYVEKIKTNNKELLQVSSKITGELEDNYNSKIGNIIFEMLPAGSISGAPKKKTIEIIKKAEQQKRGYYTGIFGIFDGVNLDSAVMIRFIENKNGNLFFRSGGGITFMSDVRLEYKELLDKVYVPITRNN